MLKFVGDSVCFERGDCLRAGGGLYFVLFLSYMGFFIFPTRSLWRNAGDRYELGLLFEMRSYNWSELDEKFIFDHFDKKARRKGV